MSMNWKQGVWPKDKHLWFREDGEWRTEIDSTGDGYKITVRREGIMVRTLPVNSRGEGMSDYVKREAKSLYQKCKDGDLKPLHSSSRP